MSEVMNVHSGAATAHAEHHDGHGHHHQSFVSKYIFSQDHKTIAKQFLITGIDPDEAWPNALSGG